MHTEQNAHTEHLKMVEKLKQEIRDIERGYHHTRMVKITTIELAESYIKNGYAEAPVRYKFDCGRVYGDSAEMAHLPRIPMHPVTTGRPVQDVWNIWSEAESVAVRAARY